MKGGRHFAGSQAAPRNRQDLFAVIRDQFLFALSPLELPGRAG